MSRRCSVSLRILLVSAVMLLGAGRGLCGCYKRIFSFGDSIIDTGNFAHMAGNGPCQYKEFPFGMTFFRHPTGRISDGRVLVDFYAQALQLPLLPPSLPEKESGKFPYGANFAVLAATALPPDYFRRWNHKVASPFCLGVQIGWFKEMLHRIAPGDSAKRKLLSESLIVLGEIGGNDYNFWFGAAKPREQAYQFIPDVVARIGSAAQILLVRSSCRSHIYACTLRELIGMGAKAIMIPNNFPIGCVPAQLTAHEHDTRPADYDEHGCLRWFNDFSQRHNQALRAEVNRLRAQHRDVRLIYADYYGAAMEFVRDPHRFGIGDPLVACCGGDNRHHTSKRCDRTAKIWGNPSGFASWDGVHMTEKAYEVISHGVLNGPFADPPLLRTC
ncbi:hypothetical protein BS78_03G212800 [Paspalum vaginatum]|nr:hypothetical protein BS78_03G212800 [Paspalum vaginatum]